MPTEIENLYREHRAGLVRLVERELRNHHDAEDVVQTAFVDAQRALERGTIPHNPPAWLAAIALNAGRRLRKRSMNAEPLEEFAVQEAEKMPELRAALESLPKEQRAAVVYRDLLGLSYSETAEQMGTSVNAVTMLLHRGRTQLRAALGAIAGGLGLWRWARRAGMQQVAAVKVSAAVVVAAGLATTGIVAAREVAPRTDRSAAAAPAASIAPLGSPTEEAARTPGSAGSVVALDSARRDFMEAGGSSVSTGAAPIPGSAGAATPPSAGSSTAGTVLSPTTSPSSPTVSTSIVALPTLTVPTVPISVPAVTATVSTPIATVTVTTPTGTTVTVPTPIVTVTLPIP